MAFVTLTYHEKWTDIKRDLDKFKKRIRRRHPGIMDIWRLEAQRRGAPHFHVLLFFPPDKTKLMEGEKVNIAKCWHEIVDPGNIHHAKHGVDVKVFKDGFEGAEIYCQKYCAKLRDGTAIEVSGYTGNYWGRSQNLPIAPLEEIPLNETQEIEARRTCRGWLRRHPNKKARRYAKSIVSGHNSRVLLKSSEVAFREQLAQVVKSKSYPTQPARWVNFIEE